MTKQKFYMLSVLSDLQNKEIDKLLKMCLMYKTQKDKKNS